MKRKRKGEKERGKKIEKGYTKKRREGLQWSGLMDPVNRSAAQITKCRAAKKRLAQQ
jgi:hypothetical protein